jgi:hypothetical protein
MISPDEGNLIISKYKVLLEYADDDVIVVVNAVYMVVQVE